MTALLDCLQCNDCYYGVNRGVADLIKAAGNYTLLHDYQHHEGYGYHIWESIIRTGDGRIIHTECGGCSCGGSGSWSYEDSVEAAVRMVSDYMKEHEIVPTK